MNQISNIQIASIIFGGISLLCGILFTYFRFMNEGAITKEKEETKLYYHQIWRRIDSWKIEELPDKAINCFFEIENLLIKIIYWMKDNFSAVWLGILSSLSVLSTWYFGINEYGLFSSNTSYSFGFFTSCFIAIFFLLCFFLQKDIVKIWKGYFGIKSKIRLENISSFKLVYLNYFIFQISGIITWFLLKISNIEFTTSSANAFASVMFINFCFDYITILITFFFLKVALKCDTFLSKLLIIISDILLCFLITLMLLYSFNSLLNLEFTQSEIISTVLGYSIDDSSWKFNKWFLIVHTTFIPTILYLTLILILILSKYVILPIGKIVGKASIVEKPHYYTATFFGFIASCSAMMAYFLKFLHNVINSN